MYVNVIVDVPIKDADKGFTYKVPEAFLLLIKPGMRVTVPFGRKHVEGFIIDITKEIPTNMSISQIKSIINIIDATPVLNNESIQLGRWMTDRYFTRLATAYQAMLPSGIKSKATKRIFCDLSPEQIQTLTITDSQRELLNYLAFEKHIKESQIFDKFANSEIDLEKLKKLGYIKEITGYKTKSKPQLIQYITWNHSVEIEKVQELFKKAKRQYQIAKFLIEHNYIEGTNDGIAITELEQELGSVRHAIKAMAYKEYIIVSEMEIKRVPNDIIYQDFQRPTLSIEQQRSFEAIINSVRNHRNDTFLLYGVTGSGKTEVYLKVIDAVINEGKQAIVLVPEISLTPQIVVRFKKWFGESVAVMHSRLSNGERYDEWRRMKDGEAKIVVGARSAIFAPFSNLGLIVIDEEHETTYKQEETPRYDAREIAIFRAKWHSCPVILGSATPSVESYYLATTSKYRLLTLNKRVHNQIMPDMKIVDMRKELAANNHHIFSRELQSELENSLNNKYQSILFINRRGHSNFVICRSCGQVSYCPYCNITLTYHQREHNLQCHYCNHQKNQFEICESCGSDQVNLFGIGTEKIEQELKLLFPKARVLRMDVDTTKKKGEHQRLIEQFQNGHADILIGTQMIAKGLDFPNVALVGVISADTALNLPDFRSSEKTFQLITQVGGRAGRHQVPGKVIVQSYNPDHYSIRYAVKYEYEEFFEKELSTRKQLGYPPFSRLILFTFSHTSEIIAKQFAKQFASCIEESSKMQEVTTFILGPSPATLSKIKNRYRYSLILKYASWQETAKVVRRSLENMQTVADKSQVIINIDVNPQMLL